MTKGNKIFLIILSAGIFIALTEVAYLYTKRDKLFNSAMPPVTPAVATTTSALYVRQVDGTLTDKPEDVTSTLVAVMIDNHPNARPQSGLSQARVVYEAPVEGGITRFFALFAASDEVAKVGPVRSARPYFLDWLSEYGNTPFWHAGGSQEALDLIKKFSIWDVNEFYFGNYFWRAEGRDAPHNLYTASDKWQKLVVGTPKEYKEWEGWKFDPAVPSIFTTLDVEEIQIRLEPNYLIAWKYDKENGHYDRFQNGNPVQDESGSGMYANTVIIEEVEVEVVDNEGRKVVGTIGSGDARVLRDGKSIRGSWRKDSREGRTRFYDLGGREIPLKPGKIWIEVVPQNTPMEVSS